jgi:hypothetical protein
MAPPARTLVLVLIFRSPFELFEPDFSFLFCAECRASRGAARDSIRLGAPNSGASFDPRLGPHWRYLLAFCL